MTRRKLRPPFDRAVALEFARLALANPPRRPFIERPTPVGDCVARFVLPLELCLTTNRRSSLHWSSVAQLKDRILSQLRVQAGALHLPTLSGRPQVMAVRFSSQRTDTGAGWEKDAIDALLTPKVIARKGGVKQRKGLGLLEDDSDACISRHVWWEEGPHNGFVYLAVWTG